MSEYGSSFEFYVSFQNGSPNHADMSFAKISNLESKIEYDVVLEGGNPTPVLLPIPSKQPETITFEKGMLLGNSQGFWETLRPGMVVENVVIYVRRYNTTVRTLGFERGIVLSKEYPLLDAMSHDVYIEKLQIAHSGLKEDFYAYSGSVKELRL